MSHRFTFSFRAISTCFSFTFKEVIGKILICETMQYLDHGEMSETVFISRTLVLKDFLLLSRLRWNSLIREIGFVKPEF